MSDGMSIDIKDVSVIVGMPIGRPLPSETALALSMTSYICGEKRLKYSVAMERSSIVQAGRDGIANTFLESGFDKLFWIDSDIVWSPDSFLRMLAWSTIYDVVTAAYPLKRDDPDGQTKLIATGFVGDDGMVALNEHGLAEIEGIGLGFTIVSREAMQAVANKSEWLYDQMTCRKMRSIFRVDIRNGNRRTEDMAFFHDLKDAGFKVMVDPWIKLGHIGEKQWDGRLADILEQGNENG